MPPSVPQSNQQPFFGQKVSKPGVPVNKATNKQLVYSNNYSTQTWYDTQNARIVEGLLPDGTYGMWVSKPGFDVTSVNAPANNELIFNSNQDIFRILLTGTVTIPALSQPAAGSVVSASATTIIGSVAQLGSTPLASMSFISSTAVTATMPVVVGTATGTTPYGGILYSYSAAVNTVTNPGSQTFVASGFNYDSSTVGGYPAATIRYYILQETAA